MTGSQRHFDLAIIGTGSGNSLVTPDFDDKQVAIIESGIFGGTCLNVGCIPTKMYVYAAEVADTVRKAGRYGVDAQLDGVRWKDIRDRIFNRIDPIAAGGQQYRIDGPNTTAFLGHARFTGPNSLLIDTADGPAELTADQIVIAAGGRPVVPDLVAAAGVPFHTSDTIMRIDELPQRLVILGCGYIGAEFAHIFSGLGSEVSLIGRGSTLLRHLDSELSERFTQLAAGKWDVRLGAEPTGLTGGPDEISLSFADGSSVTGDLLLVATGRTPNTDRLAAELAGVELLADGRVRTDCYGRTSAAGIWARSACTRSPTRFARRPIRPESS